MRLDQAKPGAVIVERREDATPRTVVAWENDGFGKTIVVVRNEAGRRTRISAKNIGRYDVAIPFCEACSHHHTGDCLCPNCGRPVKDPGSAHARCGA